MAWRGPIGHDAGVTDPLAAVLELVGLWRGGGHGVYPTIQPFGFTEEIRIGAVPGKPFLSYASKTAHVDDGRPLHAEVGWLRGVGDDRFELLVAQGSGLVELVEGGLLPGGGGLEMTSTHVGGTTTAKSVTATTRTYRWTDDELTYDLGMAAVGQPLQHHLAGRLTRVAPDA
jgi:hypothetical protein